MSSNHKSNPVPPPPRKPRPGPKRSSARAIGDLLEAVLDRLERLEGIVLQQPPSGDSASKRLASLLTKPKDGGGRIGPPP